MSEDLITEGRKLLDEALPGPWNVELIVWARSNLPALLDEADENDRVIRVLRRQRDEAEAALARVRELADEWESAPLVGSSSEEQREFDTERRCGRDLRETLDGDS